MVSNPEGSKHHSKPLNISTILLSGYSVPSQPIVKQVKNQKVIRINNKKRNFQSTTLFNPEKLNMPNIKILISYYLI
jgi:hypothetical protein